MRDFFTKTISASCSSAVRCESLASEASVDLGCKELPGIVSLGAGGSMPGIGSLARSVIDIMKMVPSTPAEMMYLPSGESKSLEISPRCSLILLRGTPKVG